MWQATIATAAVPGTGPKTIDYLPMDVCNRDMRELLVEDLKLQILSEIEEALVRGREVRLKLWIRPAWQVDSTKPNLRELKHRQPGPAEPATVPAESPANSSATPLPNSTPTPRVVTSGSTSGKRSGRRRT